MEKEGCPESKYLCRDWILENKAEKLNKNT
jgi:hypothetical protein